LPTRDISACICPRPDAYTRSLREPVHASAHRFARASFACAPSASVKPLALLRIAASSPCLLHPFAVAPRVLTREQLLRASFRSVSRLAAPRGYESHDAFDRLLPTISSTASTRASLVPVSCRSLRFACALRSRPPCDDRSLRQLAPTRDRVDLHSPGVERFTTLKSLRRTSLLGLLEGVFFPRTPRMSSLWHLRHPADRSHRAISRLR